MVFTHLPLGRSFAVGALVFIVGYVATFVTTVGRSAHVMTFEVAGRDTEAALLGEILGTQPPDWIVTGWLHYNAHFVATKLPAADTTSGFSVVTSQNLLNELGGYVLGLYVLPPVLLIGAGYFVARTSDTRGVNGDVYAAASIALGYVPLFIVGSWIFAADAENTRVIAAPLGLNTIFLGMLYSVVFGALGGLISNRRNAETRESSHSSRSM